jgi:hypothetical protein
MVPGRVEDDAEHDTQIRRTERTPLVCLLDRKRSGEDCSAVRMVGGGQVAAVGEEDTAGDRQPESGTTGAAVAGTLAAKEWVEEVREVGLRDTWAGIDDCKGHCG